MYTVLSPISGHRWCKDICPLIRSVRFLESLTVLVLRVNLDRGTKRKYVKLLQLGVF